MNELRAIAITHHNFPLETIGKFHIAAEQREQLLNKVKSELGITELMYLSTCNRVEFVFSLPYYVCPGLTSQILSAVQPELSQDEIRDIARLAERYNGVETSEHMLRVASSLESLIIGEHEIITQFRKAYEECDSYGLTGDTLRLLMKQCLKTAKEIFTHTDLSKKPVSVVSLAWQKFRDQGIQKNSRIILIGAGQIISNFAKFLSENEYTNVVVFNRSLQNAEVISRSFGGRHFTLDELKNFSEGFDAIITCTGADHAIMNNEVYQHLLLGDKNEKLVIDLALPADIDPEVVSSNNIEYVDMHTIQQMASHNIKFRQKALESCKEIIANGQKEFEKLYQERQIERAMQQIPETIKDIRATALGSVFAKDLEGLDENAKAVLDKIMSYMEKKYISIPMKMAKEVLMNEASRN